MYILPLCALISSLAFFAYGYAYFAKPHMKNEFKRFGLEKIGLLTKILEILGAIGLLVGLKIPIILVLASLGLALLMFAGLLVRIKSKDGIRESLPAISLMVLNAYIFIMAVKLMG